MANNERHLKVFINQHIEPTMRQYAVINCRLINPTGDIYFGTANYDTEVSFNLEYLFTQVEEQHREWFIAHVVRHIVDPIVEQNGWDLTDEDNNYIELLRDCQNLWDDFQKNVDKYNKS